MGKCKWQTEKIRSLYYVESWAVDFNHPFIFLTARNGNE